MYLISAIDDWLEVFELDKCAEKWWHLAVIDATVVEADSIYVLLKELSGNVQTLAMTSTQRVVGKVESGAVDVRENGKR